MMNLYIHVPFCAQRCVYCDFYTLTALHQRESYTQSLVQELRLRRSEVPADTKIRHLYLGGGTPSLLSLGNLKLIIETIQELYSMEPNGEWTIECNPDDLSPDYAKGLMNLELKRVSMGVQSFNPLDLEFLRRRHSREQVYQAVDYLRAVGIDNISLDLIYGLPNQTLRSWEDNIDQMLSLAPPHISAYHLIYEEGTPLYHDLLRGRVHEVDEEQSVEFFALLIDKLSRAGYEHYEISNFALPNQYARHNTGYWLGDEYMGLGPAAHSYIGGARSHNIASLRQWSMALSQGKRAYTIEELTPQERRHEYLMTRLRTMWGISLQELSKLEGEAYCASLLSRAEPYLQAGKLRLHKGRLQLSNSGIFTSDGIIVDLFE